MNLVDLVLWNANAMGDGKGAKIPWNDPEFSRRMLENHLSQDHDWASRRQDAITSHVDWIAKQIKPESRILDLGCGPGFYTQALARLGHRCTGVDFSPASIDYARSQASTAGVEIEYCRCDIRQYRKNTRYNCILMTFGEFNVFTREDAEGIVANCAAMLETGGLLVLEVHTYEAVKMAGLAPAQWQRQASGLFSASPHICLQENSWNPAQGSALSRFFIIDAESAQVDQYASYMQAYTPEEYRELLQGAQFAPKAILNTVEWPVGEDFSGKLQVFACLKA